MFQSVKKKIVELKRLMEYLANLVKVGLMNTGLIME